MSTENNSNQQKYCFSDLKKLRTVGKHLVEYELMAKNPSDKYVPYKCTFLGLRNCVAAIISKECETTSVMIFDTPVPDVDFYFGAGYVTTWTGKRSSSFQIVGTQEKPSDFTKFPLAEQKRFKLWFLNVKWDIYKAYKEFVDFRKNNK